MMVSNPMTVIPENRSLAPIIGEISLVRIGRERTLRCPLVKTGLCFRGDPIPQPGK